MTLIQTIISAREFAIQAHGTQQYGDLPYAVHLDEVADLVMYEYHTCLSKIGNAQMIFGTLEDAVATAYIHDILEDTEVSQDAVEAKLGATVAACANLLADPPGKSRKERKAALYDRLGKLQASLVVDQIVLVVKTCDRMANVLQSSVNYPHLFKMYRQEAATFRAAVWRPGLCEWSWQRLDYLLQAEG